MQQSTLDPDPQGGPNQIHLHARDGSEIAQGLIEQVILVIRDLKPRG